MEKFLMIVVFLALDVLTVHAQEDAEKDTKPESAYVRIINACAVSLAEPWRAGVDLAFKERSLAIDMRGGEAATYRKILFTGKDMVDVKITGQPKVIGSVPASFEKGGAYSIYVTGSVDEGGFKVAPVVVRDFPVPEEKVRKGFARVGVFNSITTFPVKLQVGTGKPAVLPPLVFTDVYLPSGSHPYRLIFPYKSSERDMSGFFIVSANSEYSGVVFAAPGRPDRPVLRFLDNTAAMSDELEAEKAAEEESKKGTATGIP